MVTSACHASLQLETKLLQPCNISESKNQSQVQVLHLGRGNPRNTWRLEGEMIESSPVEKALGMRVE